MYTAEVDEGHIHRLPSGVPCHSYDTLPSTQDQARALLNRHADGEGEFVVLANAQTTGRGRLKRPWQSPPGNLSMSCVCAPPSRLLPVLGYAVGLTVHRVLSGLLRGNVKVQLKWPNDVLVKGQKISGILIERFGQDQHWVVIGIGVNIVAAPDDLPHPATALKDWGVLVAPFDLVTAIHRELKTLLASDQASIVRDWQAHAHPVGTALEIRAADKTHRGVYCGLRADGALLLEEAGGVNPFWIGDTTIPSAMSKRV